MSQTIQTPQRIHISLPVSDLDAAVAFYRDAFGREPSRREPDYANFRTDEPPIILSLIPAPDQVPAPAADPVTHYGVQLRDKDELAHWLERARAAGLEHRIEDGARCCYAAADKVWLRDPDGHSWEIYVKTGDADKLAPDTGCCA